MQEGIECLVVESTQSGRGKLEDLEKRGSFVEMWRNLESVIQHEVNQKERSTLYQHMHVESKKKVIETSLFAGQE